MKLNLNYKTDNETFSFELDFEDDEERKEQIKLIKKTLADLNPIEINDYCKLTKKHEICAVNDKESNPTPVQEIKVQESQPVNNQPALASAGQIAYMQKLGIAIPDGCTVSQAIELINQYKIAHNIPVKNLGNKTTI